VRANLHACSIVYTTIGARKGRNLGKIGFYFTFVAPVAPVAPNRTYGQYREYLGTDYFLKMRAKGTRLFQNPSLTTNYVVAKITVRIV